MIPRRCVLHGRVHVIIVGCGRVGSGLGVGLVEQGHTVAIIDRNAKAFRRLPTDWPGTTMVGSGFDRDDLDRAGADEATSLAAVTSGDNSNILTARIARETYEIPNVVARIYDPRRAQIYLRLGIPTVATVSWTIDQVRRRLVPGEVEPEWTDPTGTLSLVERELPERWAGKRLADLPSPVRSRWWRSPGPGWPASTSATWSGQEGDVLHLMVSDTALERLRSRLERIQPSPSRSRTPRPMRERPWAPTDRRRPVMKVAIAGAGSVGTAIASDLHAGGHDVLVIEQDPDLVARIRGDLDITWVVADACEVASLDAAGLATVDVVVAATGDDEDNLVVSLLAKQEFAVPRVVARVNHPKNQWLFNESWGVDVSVSTPQLLTALVEEAVSVGSLVRLLRFEGGNAHLVEVTLADDSPAGRGLAGRPRGATRRHGGGRRARRPPDRAPGRHPAGRRRRGAGAGHRRGRGRGPAAAGGH